MGCNSDYMAPSRREIETQRAAVLLLYVNRELGKKAPEWVAKNAADIYARDERVVPELCRIIGSLTPARTESIMYARSQEARDLASWWEEHQRADVVRLAWEKAEADKERARERALSKLTPAERRALGLAK